MNTKATKRLFGIGFLVASVILTLMTPGVASAAPYPSNGSGCAEFYVVVRGDNLFRIAQRFGTTVSALADLNGITNPDRIYAGSTLCVRGESPPPSGFWYTVQRGDTLYSIARRYGVSVSTLASVNHLSNPDYIVVGQKLLIPSDGKTVQVYFAHTSLSEGAECVKPVSRAIPDTPAVGQAAIEQLLAGPTTPEEASGFWTAIPDQTRLNSLRIVDGVAYADFSGEIEAHGGGSARIMCLRQQITQSLKQFSTVREVVISVEGRTEDVLQP